MNKEFENLYRLHNAEDVVNIQLACQLIKPVLKDYSKWLAGFIIEKVKNNNYTETGDKWVPRIIDIMNTLIVDCRWSGGTRIERNDYINKISISESSTYSVPYLYISGRSKTLMNESKFSNKSNRVIQYINNKDYDKAYKHLLSFIRVILIQQIYGKLH